MKLSVSLPDEDVEFLDQYAERRAMIPVGRSPQGRPLAPHQELGVDYAKAWDEWSESGDAAAWEAVAGDGLAS